MDLPFLPPRPSDSHKGHFGLAILVGGCRGMTGAIALAGKAALRGGAGLVRLAVPDVCLDTVAGVEPSYMTLPLPSDRAGRIAFRACDQIASAAESATALGLGPGLGRSLGLDALVVQLYGRLHQPMVVDADGLNALAARRESLRSAPAPRILTPHPGEFARLIGDRVDPLQWNNAASELARRTGAVIVLKSHRTLITDGKRHWVNSTGNPGMATGGSGDVLTGLLVALLCQGLSPFDAARLAVHLHGLAGDLAAETLGQESLIASDLVCYLPQAFLQYRRRTNASAATGDENGSERA